MIINCCLSVCFQPGLTKYGNSYASSEYRPGGGPPRPPGRRYGRIGRGGGGK